jgi:dCTP deaminase
LGNRPMLDPFVPDQRGKPSFGLGSFGYDLRLGGRFLIAGDDKQAVLDPLDFPKSYFREHRTEESFDLAPHTYVLTESVERFDLPANVCAMCWGKSSYARCGLVVNVTPLEPGWKGILTMALINVASSPIRLYVGQGIAQVVFFRGKRPVRAYGEKESGGGYQDQRGVTLPQ